VYVELDDMSQELESKSKSLSNVEAEIAVAMGNVEEATKEKDIEREELETYLDACTEELCLAKLNYGHLEFAVLSVMTWVDLVNWIGKIEHHARSNRSNIPTTRRRLWPSLKLPRRGTSMSTRRTRGAAPPLRGYHGEVRSRPHTTTRTTCSLRPVAPGKANRAAGRAG